MCKRLRFASTGRDGLPMMCMNFLAAQRMHDFSSEPAKHE